MVVGGGHRLAEDAAPNAILAADGDTSGADRDRASLAGGKGTGSYLATINDGKRTACRDLDAAGIAGFTGDGRVVLAIVSFITIAEYAAALVQSVHGDTVGADLDRARVAGGTGTGGYCAIDDGKRTAGRDVETASMTCFTGVVRGADRSAGDACPKTPLPINGDRANADLDRASIASGKGTGRYLATIDDGKRTACRDLDAAGIAGFTGDGRVIVCIADDAAPRTVLASETDRTGTDLDRASVAG